MKRSGFTMVELIFVIVIIGILAAVALPKFGGVRDKAKINSEYSALSGLDGAITAKKEFRYDDFGDDNISWHDSGLANDTAIGTTQAGEYATINKNKKVLSAIAKKTENLKIVGVFLSNGDEVNATTDTTPYKNSLLLIKGSASDPTNGVLADKELPGEDALGKPDKNDVWVFNPNNWDVNITANTTLLYSSPVVVPAQSVALVDVNGTAALDVTDLEAVRSDSNANPENAVAVN